MTKFSPYYRKILVKYRKYCFSRLDSLNHNVTYKYRSFVKLSPKARKYIVLNGFLLSKVFFTLLLLCSFGWSFTSSGDCGQVIQDYALLTKKSVFLPSTLNGECIVENEKHLPKILKAAGFNYKVLNDIITISEIQPYNPPSWKPQEKLYKIEFLFIHLGDAINCGLSMDDIIFKWHNLTYDFNFAGQLGCPALDQDGSFALSVNASLKDEWFYTHGIETERTKSRITSATGAVTTDYEFITSGLSLRLWQNENGVFYELRYTAKNGAITTSKGGIVGEVLADILDEYEKVRKFWFIPLGSEKENARYRLRLKITETTRNG